MVADVDLTSLVAVGEKWYAPTYFEDEHYLVLVLDASSWVQLGESCAGRNDLVRVLGELHGTAIEFECLWSGDDRGRVLLPERLRGRPLFDVEPLASEGWLERLHDRLSPRITWRLASEVRALAAEPRPAT